MEMLPILAVIFFILYSIRYFTKKDGPAAYPDSDATPAHTPPASGTDIIFSGSKTGIKEEEVHDILTRHCSYYRSLEEKLQLKFLTRVKFFMSSKTFIIKSGEVYKRMPVLVSAAAVQLTFGLKNYLLPFYKHIRIYPGEYFADHSFKVLAGNVQGTTITIAWNHFLQGFADRTDGSNVGLHEMSHALYFQKLVIDKTDAMDFCRQYDYLIGACKEAYQLEVKGSKDLYSSYADTNLQEFWAETVELFFEKPAELRNHYPEVFEATSILLNQNPENKANPVLEEHAGPKEKMGSDSF